MKGQTAQSKKYTHIYIKWSKWCHTQFRWILRNATSLPEFVGNTVVIGQSCTRVPMPNTTWHPIGTYDEYLSNCQQSAYCELTSLCVRKLTHGEVCMSSNQCAHLSCINQTCQIGQSSSNTNTVYIVLYVVGSVLFVVIVACIYLVARKRKKRRQEDVPLPKPDNQHVFDVLDRNFNNDSVQRLSDDKPPPPYSP